MRESAPFKEVMEAETMGGAQEEERPPKELMETETMGGAQEEERPLQRGYGNRNNGRSS